MWRFLKLNENATTSSATATDDQEKRLQCAVSEEISKVKETSQRKRKAKNTHYTAEEKAKIGRFAAENGNSAAVKKFNNMPESTVRGFKTKYLELLKKAGPMSNPSSVTRIDHKTLGRPLKLGSSLDKEVRIYDS